MLENTKNIDSLQYKDFNTFYSQRIPGDYLIDQSGKVYLVGKDRSVRSINKLIKKCLPTK